MERNSNEIIELIYILNNLKTYENIKQDFERLRMLEKYFDILKRKKVNVYHLWACDNYEQYRNHYLFNSEYCDPEDMLTKSEFKFLKKELGD